MQESSVCFQSCQCSVPILCEKSAEMADKCVWGLYKMRFMICHGKVKKEIIIIICADFNFTLSRLKFLRLSGKFFIVNSVLYVFITTSGRKPKWVQQYKRANLSNSSCLFLVAESSISNESVLECFKVNKLCVLTSRTSVIYL